MKLVQKHEILQKNRGHHLDITSSSMMCLFIIEKSSIFQNTPCMDLNFANAQTNPDGFLYPRNKYKFKTRLDFVVNAHEPIERSMLHSLLPIIIDIYKKNIGYAIGIMVSKICHYLSHVSTEPLLYANTEVPVLFKNCTAVTKQLLISGERCTTLMQVNIHQVRSIQCHNLYWKTYVTSILFRLACYVSPILCNRSEDSEVGCNWIASVVAAIINKNNRLTPEKDQKRLPGTLGLQNPRTKKESSTNNTNNATHYLKLAWGKKWHPRRPKGLPIRSWS